MTALQVAPRSGLNGVTALTVRLERVRASLVDLERSVDLTSFGPQRESARNLLHYLAFRHFDLRAEQVQLAHWGLSSLGRSESHVLYNLDMVLGWLRGAGGRPTDGGAQPPRVDPERGREILARHATDLLGPGREGRAVRIMVTMPPEGATNYQLVRELIEGGMDCARINCAHDGQQSWADMVRHIRRAEGELDRRCLVEMDLEGPKIRTGPVSPGPAVVKVRPQRDRMGKVTSPGVLWLVPPGGSTAVPPGEAWVPVRRSWAVRRRPEDRLELLDARGALRKLRVSRRAGTALRTELVKTAYVTNGSPIAARLPDGRKDRTRVGTLRPFPEPIEVVVGESLRVTTRPVPGASAVREPDGRVLRPAHISCSLPGGLGCVRKGETVWFDDGKIGGVVRSAGSQGITVEVTHAPSGRSKLGPDKGINLPDTHLELPSLSPEDRVNLHFVVRHADLLGLSFVQGATDVREARKELARLGRPDLGILLKVETRRGFEELPAILFAALQQPPAGIMIARGDLAVEVGFERLAEVQEEILWLCEAAHVPSVWATQVLEGLAKVGLPSRAEVTDAAMGERSECVMLNKGPHIVEAVRALDGILRRMQSHQTKKTAMLRHLSVVDKFFSESGLLRTPSGR